MAAAACDAGRQECLPHQVTSFAPPDRCIGGADIPVCRNSRLSTARPARILEGIDTCLLPVPRAAGDRCPPTFGQSREPPCPFEDLPDAPIRRLVLPWVAGDAVSGRGCGA